MKIYNYNGLLKAIGEINTNKTKAENARLMSKKQKLIDLENKVKSMGILDDWYDLKSACRKANVGIMPYGRYNEDKKGPLMDACHYFKDNGIFGIDTNTSMCYNDFFGFINSNRDGKISWIFKHEGKITDTKLKNEEEEISYKIEALNKFLEMYEEYREIQLQRIFNAMGKITEETNKIRKEV